MSDQPKPAGEEVIGDTEAGFSDMMYDQPKPTRSSLPPPSGTKLTWDEVVAEEHKPTGEANEAEQKVQTIVDALTQAGDILRMQDNAGKGQSHAETTRRAAQALNMIEAALAKVKEGK